MSEGLFFERLSGSDADFEPLYKLKCEPHDVYWSGYTTSPDKMKFRAWFEEQLKRDDRDIYLVRKALRSGDILGYLYITYPPEEQQIGLISHGVTAGSIGKGIGSSIVNFAVNLFINGFLKAEEIQAWIVETNIASIKTFTKNGFVKTTRSRKEFYRSMDKEVMLENYRLVQNGIK
jgi:RimJ/RimL family protein N-acetyltransferase